MEYTYAPNIFAAGIGVILLITNQGGVEGWKKRLLAAQAPVRAVMMKRRKPYLIRVALDGSLTKIRLYRKNGNTTHFLY
jgi:hypothetical protein